MIPQKRLIAVFSPLHCERRSPYVPTVQNQAEIIHIQKGSLYEYSKTQSHRF